MQIVINIPEEVLKSRQYCRYFGAWSEKLTETIESGTPLPKGHGDLKDMGKIILDKFTDTEVYSRSSCLSTDYKRGYNDAINNVAYVLVKATTVVEADKEVGDAE